MALNENIGGNISEACNNFSSDFYKALSSHSTGNIITSPISTHIILSLLSYGTDGTTLQQLQNALYLQDVESLHEEFTFLMSTFNNAETMKLLTVNNAIYIQNDFEVLAEFSALSTDIFKCLISKTNFEENALAAQQINAWVKESTKSKIQEVVSAGDFDEFTKMVLLNTIYFKGHWSNRFDPTLTANREFHVSKQEKKLIPTMFQKSKFYSGKMENLNASFIEIPYTNEDMVMLIILPDEIDGLSQLEQNLNWKELMNQPRQKREFELYLPKFKFEVTSNLETPLRQIGVHSIFENSADLSRISKTPLKVSKVVQKCFIEVNEEGTEAAAATAVQIRLKRCARMPEVFLVNRPFMFAIQLKSTGSLIFIGSVRDIISSPQRDEL